MACSGWLDREYLVRTAVGEGGELLSPTQARTPDGRLVEVPGPCAHPAVDCPPLGRTGEPVCCDEPMIHNSFTGHYECADAYLRLLDDGVLGGVPELSDTDAMDDYQRERYEHWRTGTVAA